MVTVKLVCSVCGSDKIGDTRYRSLDDRWPMARCRNHFDKRNPWTPLVSERAFEARKRRPAQAKPEDVFGGLPEDERSRLERPLKLHHW
jgi:hypothetical protein